MKDTGRIRMESYKGIMYCESYMNDEVTIADLQSMIDEINENYNGHSDVILKKAGSYSVSLDAQVMLHNKVKAFRNFVYVADTIQKENISKFSAQSFMANYNTKVASTKEEAYEILRPTS
jgi:hypothetical protein